MAIFLHRLLEASLCMATVLVWLTPLPASKPVTLHFDHWPLAEDFLSSEPPAGTLVHIMEEDEAELVWRRAADVLRRVSPAEYRCWVGLELNCEHHLTQVRLRGASSRTHVTVYEHRGHARGHATRIQLLARLEGTCSGQRLSRNSASE